MPNCFQLISKETGHAAVLNRVDEELCKFLDVPVHPKNYVANWFNNIGFSLACGRDWAWIREQYYDCPELLKCVDYLEEHYTSTAWAEVGRR